MKDASLHPDALLSFSLRLVPADYRQAFLNGPAQLQGWIPHPMAAYASVPEDEPAEPTTEAANSSSSSSEQAEGKVKRQKLSGESQAEPQQESKFEVGDVVIISGLSNAQYNGCKGQVSSAEKNGRYGVKIKLANEVKRLGLKPVNLSLVSKAKPAAATASVTGASNSASASSSANAGGGGLGAGTGGMFDTVMADPEVQEKLKNPKFARALAEVKANPAAFFQYMGDPEIGPFITKMMGKMGMGF